jgi:hypothetical protein
LKSAGTLARFSMEPPEIDRLHVQRILANRKPELWLTQTDSFGFGGNRVENALKNRYPAERSDQNFGVFHHLMCSLAKDGQNPA